MGDQAIVVPSSFSLAVSRDPNAILGEAKKAADALTSVIKNLPADRKVMMNGKQYIEFDHWQLVGRFYGCSAKVVQTEYVEVGDAKGFMCRAVVLDAEGREISAAESMCLNDEDKWSARPKYEWHYVKKSGGLSLEDPGKDELIWEGPEGKKKPKKERVLAGSVAVPMNQLRSMAQTRACAKALRNVFSWVVVLAGYAPTPAEELTGDETEDKPADERPAAKPPEQRAASAPPAGDVETYEGPVLKVTNRKINTKDGEKTKYEVFANDKLSFGTIYEKNAEKAEAIAGSATLARIVYVKTKWGNDLRSITVLDAEAEN